MLCRNVQAASSCGLLDGMQVPPSSSRSRLLADYSLTPCYAKTQRTNPAFSSTPRGVLNSLPEVCINFSWPRGVGMAAAHEGQMRAFGLHGLAPADASAAFAGAGYAPQVVRAGLDLRRFRQVSFSGIGDLEDLYCMLVV